LAISSSDAQGYQVRMPICAAGGGTQLRGSEEEPLPRRQQALLALALLALALLPLALLALALRAP
jgi:hypothetical protein